MDRQTPRTTERFASITPTEEDFQLSEDGHVFIFSKSVGIYVDQEDKTRNDVIQVPVLHHLSMQSSVVEAVTMRCTP